MYQIYMRRRDRSITIYTQRKNRGPYGQLKGIIFGPKIEDIAIDAADCKL